MIPLRTLATLSALALAAAPIAAQHAPGHVLDHRFVTEGAGGFTGILGDEDAFGSALCTVGDIDGNGVDDIAVGASGTDLSGGLDNSGRVWLLFLDANGDIIGNKAIDAQQGTFPFPLLEGDRFGSAVAPAGDLDNDGVPDLWVGARGDDTGAPAHPFVGTGAIYAVMLEPNGKAKDAIKISADSGLALLPGGAFGNAIADVGDLNNDGISDLVVGAPFSDTPGNSRGAVWILHMQAKGELGQGFLLSPQTEPDLAALPAEAQFGYSVAALGDIDGNGTPDFVVGAPDDDVLQTSDGSIWFVRTDGGFDIDSATRFGPDAAVFQGDGPAAFHYFGRSLAAVGDLDQDGKPELAVGAANGGAFVEGSVWFLHLGGPGASYVTRTTRVDGDEGFVPFPLISFDFFGFGLAPAGDLNLDGTPDLLVGMPGHDAGGNAAGAMALFALRGPTFVDLGGEVGNGPPPALGINGTLVAGEDFTVQLKNGPPGEKATAVLGFTAIHAPFKGGVMVPAPDQLLSGFTLDGIGFLSVTSPWPLGIPVGFEIYLQLWAPDVNAPLGYAGSNAMLLIAGA